MKADLPKNDEPRAQLARALTALRDLRSQLDELKQAQSEPIAVIGLGCRFPGAARDPDAFWQLLLNQQDAIREVPPDRWNIEAYYAVDPDTRTACRSVGLTTIEPRGEPMMRRRYGT